MPLNVVNILQVVTRPKSNAIRDLCGDLVQGCIVGTYVECWIDRLRCAIKIFKS
jgi:hypothetical protein